eukprot:765905-Hanusia_phi.AAC.3
MAKDPTKSTASQALRAATAYKPLAIFFRHNTVKVERTLDPSSSPPPRPTPNLYRSARPLRRIEGCPLSAPDRGQGSRLHALDLKVDFSLA